MKRIILNGIDVRVCAKMHVNLTDLQRAADVADEELLRPALWLLTRDGEAVAQAEAKRTGVLAATRKGDDWYVAAAVACAYLRHVGSHLEKILIAQLMEIKNNERERAQAKSRHYDEQQSRNTSPSTESMDISPFNFEGKDVRVVTGSDGEPWFVATDVCDIIGTPNPTQAIAKLDTDERSTFFVGRQGKANTINESGLYTLVVRCHDAIRPGTTAHRFRKWVTNEVLPSIRKTGRYEAPHQEQSKFIDTGAEMLADALLARLYARIDQKIDERVSAAIAALSEPANSFAPAKIDDPIVQPVEVYERATHTAQQLIAKLDGCNISHKAFHKIALAAGIMRSQARVTKSRTRKPVTVYDWEIVGAGLEFGENVGTSVTRPLFYPSKFEGLLRLMNSRVGWAAISWS